MGCSLDWHLVLSSLQAEGVPSEAALAASDVEATSSRRPAKISPLLNLQDHTLILDRVLVSGSVLSRVWEVGRESPSG